MFNSGDRSQFNVWRSFPLSNRKIKEVHQTGREFEGSFQRQKVIKLNRGESIRSSCCDNSLETNRQRAIFIKTSLWRKMSQTPLKKYCLGDVNRVCFKIYFFVVIRVVHESQFNFLSTLLKAFNSIWQTFSALIKTDYQNATTHGLTTKIEQDVSRTSIPSFLKETTTVRSIVKGQNIKGFQLFCGLYGLVGCTTSLFWIKDKDLNCEDFNSVWIGWPT